jgi:hypothetical protein
VGRKIYNTKALLVLSTREGWVHDGAGERCVYIRIRNVTSYEFVVYNTDPYMVAQRPRARPSGLGSAQASSCVKEDSQIRALVRNLETLSGPDPDPGAGPDLGF